MAYYNKEEVLEYVSESLEEIDSKNLKPLTPENEVKKKLEDEDDMVGFFWIEHDDESSEGEKIKFQGKSFYRVDHDIYTDDRFAIDLYQAMEMGITVTDVIRKRNQEKEMSKQGIVDIQEVEQKVKENIEKNGDE